MIVKLEKFEGPLALLLKMIEKEEMDITKVNLANIADEYVTYIKSGKIDPEHIADFLVVAAKLLLIKSRALLPYLYVEPDQEIEEFEEQLRMYKEFLDATKNIEKQIKKKKFMYAREFNRKSILMDQSEFTPPKKLAVKDLAKTFHEIIDRLHPQFDLEESRIMNEINIEEKIASIKEMLNSKISIVFSQLSNTIEDRTELVVSFLAVLELMKQHDIIISQIDLFGEIEINKVI
ncbi:MAG: segregation/condensation protein A [bacterium]